MATPANRTRLSLQARWTLALLVTGALPLGLLTYATTGIQRRGLEAAERQLEVSVIDHVAELVERALHDAAAATHRVGEVLTTESFGADDDARIALARDAVAGGGMLGEVAIYRADGTLLDAIQRARNDGRPEVPPLEKLSAHLVSTTKPSWLPPSYAGEGRAHSVIRYVEPILSGNEVRAFVVGTLAPRGLSERLEGISRDRFEGRDDGVLLLDGAAKVMAGGGDSLPIGGALAGKDLFGAQTLAASAFTEPFALATEFVAADGESMVGAARSLPGRGWAVVVRRPASAVYAALRRSRQLLLATGGAFALLALGIGSLVAARTVRPVRSLVELTRAYARRDFAARSTVATGDELELLGTSMTEMADQLSAGEKEIARRAAVEAGLSRYLPAEVAHSIAEGKQSLALGGERRRITVLFADVVSFTSFSEGAAPEKVVALLNELFTVMTEVVFRHGGTVDKFIGDCVMAIFGAPAGQPDQERRALAVAEDMHRFVEANSPAWKDKYGVDVQLGIGIACGEALVGNLGSEVRMEYTAIGDTVNVAARLEGLARPGQTLVTAEVARAAGDEFTFAPLGEHALRGKAKPIAVLELR